MTVDEFRASDEARPASFDGFLIAYVLERMSTPTSVRVARWWCRRSRGRWWRPGRRVVVAEAAPMDEAALGVDARPHKGDTSHTRSAGLHRVWMVGRFARNSTRLGKSGHRAVWDHLGQLVEIVPWAPVPLRFGWPTRSKLSRGTRSGTG